MRAAARGKLPATLQAMACPVCEEIRTRLAGESMSDRAVSLADPNARSIRKSKAGKPTEFGSVHQIAEITPDTLARARAGSCYPRRPRPAILRGDAVAGHDRRARTARPQKPAEVASTAASRCAQSARP
jgi:hypothetical protein